MSELSAQALLNSVCAQRNRALDDAAQLAAMLETVNAQLKQAKDEIVSMKERIERLGTEEITT